MKAKIVTTAIGCFGVSEDDKIIIYVKFPKNVEKIVKLLEESKSKKIKEYSSMLCKGVTKMSILLASEGFGGFTSKLNIASAEGSVSDGNIVLSSFTNVSSVNGLLGQDWRNISRAI